MQTQECYYWPLFEIPIGYLVRKSFPADPNAFQNTITPQLVQNKLVIHHACGRAAWGHTDCSSTALSAPFCSMFHELPGVFVSLGMMQRTKWGWVVRKLDINLFRFSCKTEIISNLYIISVLKVMWLCWKAKIQSFLLTLLVNILRSCVGISKVNGHYWRICLLC